MLKNNYQNQKIGFSKKYRYNDSESSIQYKKNDKYMDLRESSFDKIKNHSYSNQSLERIEMNI